MGAGESRAMEGTATLLGAGGGAKSNADVEVIGDEGDAEACRTSQKDGKESAQCAVPLRIGLLALDAPIPSDANCPAGTVSEGGKCRSARAGAEVVCGEGKSWDGTQCSGLAGRTLSFRCADPTGKGGLRAVFASGGSAVVEYPRGTCPSTWTQAGDILRLRCKPMPGAEVRSWRFTMQGKSFTGVAEQGDSSCNGELE
jgi:hypothetical protein